MPLWYNALPGLGTEPRVVGSSYPERVWQMRGRHWVGGCVFLAAALAAVFSNKGAHGRVIPRPADHSAAHLARYGGSELAGAALSGSNDLMRTSRSAGVGSVQDAPVPGRTAGWGARDGMAKRGARRAKGGRARSGKIRVLLADDDDAVRKALASLLADTRDIDVIGEAANGLEALESCRTTHPDVVVMDVTMPVMDGVEATRRILAESPGVQVIALSAYDDPRCAERMREAGAAAFLDKARAAGNLVAAIRDCAAPASRPQPPRPR